MSDSNKESKTSSSESLKKRQKMEGDKENQDAMEVAPGGGLDATSLARFSRQNAALGELNRSGALWFTLVQYDKFLVPDPQYSPHSQLTQVLRPRRS